METKTPSLSIRRVPLDALHLDPKNAREHGAENMAAIIASLRRFGQAEPIVVQKSTGRIIGGNGRLVAMQQLGWKKCDVVELDVDDVTVTALGIALNRTGELAAWNDEALSRILRELRDEDSLAGIGFDNAQIDELLAELEDDLAPDYGADEDAVPEPPDTAVTRPGDLWVLGNHRVLCGDSASTTDVDRLLAGAAIHLVNTDPPYNVRVEPRSKNAIAAGRSSFLGDRKKGSTRAKSTRRKLRPKDRPLENDFVSDEEFNRLLDAWFGNIARVLDPGRAFYIWGGYSNLGNYPGPLDDAGLYFSQAIVWDKLHPVIGRKDFMGAFEIAFYGWKVGAAHQFYGPNNATDLWRVQKVTPQAMVHLTEKPVELARRAIEYSSRRGENVLDLFGGSGSTLIAAEQLRRNAFVTEIDAQYSDVIVRRWETFTGKEAVLEGEEKTFAETEAERHDG